MRMAKNDLDLFGRTWARAMNDIIFFAEHYCQVDLSTEQKKLLLHVMFATHRGESGKKRVIARSGQGLGKTLMLCIAVAWRHLRAHGTISVITAPTAEQCRNVFEA